MKPHKTMDNTIFSENQIELGKKLILFLLSSGITLGLFVYFHSLSPFIYFTNDDLFFKTIASGEVMGQPCSRLWYIGYPVGLVISFFYKMIPTLPWYGFFLCFFIGLTMTVVLYKLLTFCQKIPSQILTVLLFMIIAYSFFFLHIAELQFTTITGIVGAGAVFLFCFWDPADHFKTSLVSGIGFLLLSALSLCIRDKGFLMLIPFIGMLGIAKYLDAGEGLFSFSQKRKNLFALGGIFLLLMAGVMLIGKIAYSSQEWKEFGAYTGASETIYDYTGYPDYDTYQDVYEKLGLTRSSYEAASHHYNIQLEPKINKETMQTLEQVALQDLSEKTTLPGKLKEMTSFFLDRHLSYTDRPLNLLVYVCYILFFVAAIIAGKKKALRDILFTGIARMVVWIYLVYNGRLPARVSQAVYIAELLILIALAMKYRLWDTKKMARFFWAFTLCVFVLLSYRFGIPKAKAAASEASSRLQFSQSFVELKHYFAENPDHLYYLDMNSFGSFTEDGLQGGQNTYGNYLFMGSWVPHSPWYEAKFEKAGIKETDAAAALFENPNVYAVFMKTEGTGYEYLSDFYAENYPGVTIEVVEEITVSNDITFQIVKGKRS